MTDVPDLVHRRAEVLAALDETPGAKPELVEATSCSRSTIDRGIDELLETGLVERAGPEFRLTATGSRILASYRSYRDAAAAYDEHRVIVDGVAPADELPPEVLVGAEVELPSPEMPSQGAKSLDDEIRAADSIRSCTPVLMAYIAEAWANAAPDVPAETVTVYSSGVLDAMRTEYGEAFEAMLETGELVPYVTDDLPRSYSFAVADGLDVAEGGSRFYLGVHDENAPLLRNDAPAAVEWGREKHRELVERGERVEP